MSDEFIIGLIFVTPTILAIAIAEFSKRRSRRSTDATLHAGCKQSPNQKLNEQDAALMDQAATAPESEGSDEPKEKSEVSPSRER